MLEHIQKLTKRPRTLCKTLREELCEAPMEQLCEAPLETLPEKHPIEQLTREANLWRSFVKQARKLCAAPIEECKESVLYICCINLHRHKGTLLVGPC